MILLNKNERDYRKIRIELNKAILVNHLRWFEFLRTELHL